MGVESRQMLALEIVAMAAGTESANSDPVEPGKRQLSTSG